MAPSLWRRPGTKTYTLVHRSQRDPLINDPTASDRVLKLVDNKSNRKNRGDGASTYAATEAGDLGVAVDDFTTEAEDAKLAQGDAAAYGIFYDDADDYDYLQHLRPVGGDANGNQKGAVGDAFFIEAPDSKNSKGKGKAKDRAGGFELSEAALARHETASTSSGAAAAQQPSFEMPDDVLPSHPLDEVSYAELLGSRVEPSGLRPDLDPSVREVLEALDDDAYAEGEEEDEDAFWDGVLSGGQVGAVEEQDWEDEEDDGEVPTLVNGSAAASRTADAAVAEGVERLNLNDKDGDGTWAAVQQFKATQSGPGNGSHVGSDEEEYDSEGGDTIADLRSTLAKTKRPMRKASGSAMGSAFSMSSSSMFRNDGLRTLDDRFDQIEKLYDDDSDDSWGGPGSEDDDEHEHGSDCDHDHGHAPVSAEPQGEQRAALEAILDDFLQKYEVIGGKYRHQLEGAASKDVAPLGSRDEKLSRLDRLRNELANLDLGAGEDEEAIARRKEKERIMSIVERQYEEEATRKRKGKDKIQDVTIIEDNYQDRWDCETVLSTYSNLSNHPRMLRLRDSRGPKPAQIKIDPKTGFPMVDGKSVLEPKTEDTIMEEEEEGEEEEEYVIRETIKRPRAETAEEKKARKAAVKAERASRREEKKGTKEAFNSETKRQKRVQGRRVADGGAADIKSGMEGVRRLA
ncbi:hypothetical protein BMF94_3316 [Rhodotorula taiwanensis]|uniref:Uncharacterized protein n=1 Tax=Rhodotorula taiwanensis TaxID=741276 RepID=A0A2S5BAI1_9BASI|nr:hypothetical protein BMF94_3316 [Rhodotorula taiwanensis]